MYIEVRGKLLTINLYIVQAGFHPENIFGGEAASSANYGIAATYVALPFFFGGGKLGYLGGKLLPGPSPPHWMKP